MDRLDKLESESIYILREAYKHFEDLGMLWSMGKDSTVMLYLAKKAFFGHVPFPLVHIDTTFLFEEMYKFKEEKREEWDLNILTGKNEEALENGVSYDTHDSVTVSEKLRTEALKDFVRDNDFNGLVVGIRADEEGSRSKERIFSKRTEDFEWEYTDQPPELWDQFNTDFDTGEHIRVHPILRWTELDVWKYIKREEIEVVDLYFASDGKRYRSLGCEPVTNPVESDADTVDKIIEELKETKKAERAGREQDEEANHGLQELRAEGYM